MPRRSPSSRSGMTAGKVFHGAGLRQFGQAVADLGRCPARSRTACARSSSTSCSPTACSRWSPTSPVACARRRRTRRSARGCSTRTRPSSSRRPARTASCCSGRRSPTPCTRMRRRRHQEGAHLAARPVRSAAHREAPRLAPHQRAPVDAARRRGVELHRPPVRAAASARARPRRRVRLRARARARTDRARAPSSERQDEARAYYADLAASGEAPVQEKTLRRSQALTARVLKKR